MSGLPSLREMLSQSNQKKKSFAIQKYSSVNATQQRKLPPYCLSSPLIYMSSTHLCRHRANSLVLQWKKKGGKMLRSYILPHPPLALSPGSPPPPVQLNSEPWIGWSRCLGRADALGEVSTEDYVVSFLRCSRQNKYHLRTRSFDNITISTDGVGFARHVSKVDSVTGT